MRYTSLIVLCSILSFFAVAGHMQEQERVLEKVSLKNEPVEVSEIKAKNKPVSFDHRFASSDDWLKGLTFKLKNISTKPIIHAAIELDFPEVRSQDAPFTLSLQYGQVPDLPNPDVAQGAPVPPDESADLVLDEEIYEGLKRVIERYGKSPSVTRVRVRISTIIFQDGTAWRNGFQHRRDPNNPRRWVIIENPTGTVKKEPRNTLLQKAEYFNLNQRSLFHNNKPECPTCPPTPTPPSDMLPVAADEILVPKAGGSLVIDGIKINSVDPKFPEFSTSRKYMLFISLDASTQVGMLRMGPFATYAINSDETIEPINKHLDHPLKYDIKARLGNTVGQIRAKLRSMIASQMISCRPRLSTNG